jgi:hypothetical protein
LICISLMISNIKDIFTCFLVILTIFESGWVLLFLFFLVEF